MTTISTYRQLARHTFLLCCPIQNEISVKLVIFFSHPNLWKPYRQLARHSFQLRDKINLPWHTPWLKIHPTCRKSSDAPSVTVSSSSNLSLSRKLIFLRKIQFCLIYLFLIFAQTLSKSLMKTFFGPKRFLNFKQLFCLIK